MDIEEFRLYCLGKPGVSEEMPFGPDVLVFKLLGKLFTLCGMEEFKSINLKCDPERAIDLRERYDAVEPGFHMNKKHWNTVYFNRDLHDDAILDLIDHSYDLIKASLSKAKKAGLDA